MINRLTILSITLFSLAFSAVSTAKNKEFPGRDLYPTIPYIELDDFKREFKDAIIVDVRSQYEYETLRIKDAKNIPLASKTFLKDMRLLRQNSDKKIIVYCNGRTCMKSYKAARKCSINDIKDVVAFDGGVMDWSKAYPKLALLLGEPLNDAKNLISKDEFKKHLISPAKFGDRIAESSDIVLDVRDRFQREGISIFVGREYRVYLDDTKRLERFINKAKANNKGLLIYDAAGKQVRWLQYYLKKKGITDYYFMEGGISAYYKGMTADLAK